MANRFLKYMPFFDILQLALRNLREAKLRATLTSMGVIVGVAVIVTMVSFGLGLQRNLLSRFKALDLFNEMTVFGKSFAGAFNFDRPPGRRNQSDDRRTRTEETLTRVLDDSAIAEIGKIPGVAYVEPAVWFVVELRANGRTFGHQVAGANVPNASSRFKEFDAGQMISSPSADEAVVTEDFVRAAGFTSAGDAVGKTIEFLTTGSTPNDKSKSATTADNQEPPNFFGIPLSEDDVEQKDSRVVAERTFRISGVLKEAKPDGGPGPTRGLMPYADVYIPVATARQWSIAHQGEQSRVIMALARESGAIGDAEAPGYASAIVRVTDPIKLTEVRQRLKEMGLGSFSIVDQMEQIRTVFLIIDAVLGLLGGISLLVASFGIANTMIMSILERTREIGIMKAIGAEDREIKLIFFFEAAVIGFAGGVIGALAAWGIDGISNRLAYRFILKPQGASFVDFFQLPPYLWLGAIAFALTVSILAALYPAARAARIDPVRALRHD
jgi:ABC-type antimicrobial peptide transport system permease subunit